MTAWCFVAVADIQPGSPKSYRYNPSWIKNWYRAKEQILADGPDLMLAAGDVTRDGSSHRFELADMKAEFDALPFPVHVVPGNMDTGNKHTRSRRQNRHPGQCSDYELNVTSEQLQQFASVYGPLWWSFVHRNVRFSGFSDNVINSGLPEEEAFWDWAESLPETEQAGYHVWVMHYSLFSDSPGEPTWDIENPDQYRDWYFTIDEPGRSRLLDLFTRTGATIVISGHIHCHRVRCVRGIRFEIAPAVSFGQWEDRWPDGDTTLGYLRYDVTAQGITANRIALSETADLPGRGPGGHPRPERRVYPPEETQ